jgi:adenosylcobinamide-GDP ribazoletransferase
VHRGTGDAAVRPTLDSVRLAVGTLTVAPTKPPRSVDRRVAGWAMTLAPGIGALLGVLAVLLLWLLGWAPAGGRPLLEEVLGDRVRELVVHPFLAAALVIGLLALLTRAMHLDGLADTADGLGSGRPAAGALEVMRRGDVGPFGVVTLVLVLMTQVLALGVLLAQGAGPSGLLLALVVSRLTLPLLCSRGVEAARPEGLGHLVAGSVGRLQVALAVVLAVAVLVPLALVAPGVHALDSSVALRAGAVALVALLAGGLVARRAVRRLGGITGDVLGAAVEVTFTVALVVLTVVA